MGRSTPKKAPGSPSTLSPTPPTHQPTLFSPEKLKTQKVLEIFFLFKCFQNNICSNLNNRFLFRTTVTGVINKSTKKQTDATTLYVYRRLEVLTFYFIFIFKVGDLPDLCPYLRIQELFEDLSGDYFSNTDQDLIVFNKEFFERLCELLTISSNEELNNYIVWTLTSSAEMFLPQRFREALNAFRLVRYIFAKP
jgi:hypothetical protein